MFSLVQAVPSWTRSILYVSFWFWWDPKRDESERRWRYPWNNEERSQDFQQLLQVAGRKIRDVAFRRLMSLKHGSDSPETSLDPANEWTNVEGREPLLEPCSQAMNPFCSCFTLIAHSSRLLPVLRRER